MTNGQRQLRSLIEGGTSQGAIARSLGVARSVVTRWAQGRQAPITRYRLELQKVHGIPIEAWDEPEAPSSQAPAA